MKIIVYTDFTSGNVLFHKVDSSKIGQDGVNIEAYAEAYAPSNTCEWMVLTDNANIFADREIVDEVKKRITPVKKNPGFLANCRFISDDIEEVSDFLYDKEIEYEEWSRDGEVEIRIDLDNMDENQLSLIKDRFDIKDIEKLTYLIFY